MSWDVSVLSLNCFYLHYVLYLKMFWCIFILLSILEAYRTGRGRVVVRGKTEFELVDSKTKRTAIIIKEVRLAIIYVLVLFD